jgi:hypothetical protein
VCHVCDCVYVCDCVCVCVCVCRAVVGVSDCDSTLVQAFIVVSGVDGT